ncbi:hypothetical protein APASM_2980 [Actinosynnema pretiosum subsp. pretiosum]|nr:hypothetical protein APASM_2980 [Actinosynnema pretiosum subsp. pretiosum]
MAEQPESAPNTRLRHRRHHLTRSVVPHNHPPAIAAPPAPA